MSALLSFGVWEDAGASQYNRHVASVTSYAFGTYVNGKLVSSEQTSKYPIFATMADDTQDKERKDNQLNIELSEAIAEGIYSNLAVITHSPTEFVVDFVQIVPNMPKARVKSRIILSPHHAKRLLHALEDNVRKYERQFGDIREPDQRQRQGFPPMTFNAPAGEA